MRSGFFQLILTEEASNTTAFWWPQDDGPPKLYRYKRLPFGGRNSVALFQKTMDYVLAQAKLTHCARAYVDDVLIFSKDMDSHIGHVAAVLDALHACGLRAHPKKTKLGMPEIEFVGHRISKRMLTPTQAKVKALVDMKPPSNLTELRAVLGAFNYYRCHIPDFSTIANPLNKITSHRQSGNGQRSMQKP